MFFSFFFFNDTATTEIYTLSLHDALPISLRQSHGLTIVVVTHQPELIRRLGGCVLYLVGGRVQAYECMDGIAHKLTDRRLEEHTSELQSPCNLVCRLLLEKKKKSVVGTCV